MATVLDLSGNTIVAEGLETADGVVQPVEAKAEIAALTAEATADGSDADTTQALANALKVKVNAIIAALKA
jgi:hypothetical protein